MSQEIKTFERSLTWLLCVVMACLSLGIVGLVVLVGRLW